MGYIVVDTCVWINIVKLPALHPVMEELLTYISPPPHGLILPECVAVEFNRNRPDIEKSWESALKAHINSVKQLSHVLPQEASAITALSNNAKAAMKGVGEAVRAKLGQVGEALGKASRRAHTPKQFEETCRRCLNIVPPAIRENRSSVGDCLLWLTVLDLLDDHCVWFCTDNKRDFADKHDPSKLHTDLATEISRKRHKLHFFTDITLMLDSLRTTPREIPLPRYESITQSRYCPRCGTLTEKISIHSSQYGGWSTHILCDRCGFLVDTGEPSDD